MQKDNLLNQLSYYGYSLMGPLPKSEPEKVLLGLLKQDDMRLLEGFPVVFVNMLQEKKSLKWENEKWHPSDELNEKTKHRLVFFLSLSYYLFRLFGLDKNLQERTLKLLKNLKYGNETFMSLNKPFVNSETVALDKLKLSTERLKNNFRNYVTLDKKEVQEKRHDLELELLLSELFTAYQKKLLKKRLADQSMTKTEKEYFYRVVKKRLKALANDELHQMAQSVLFQ